MTTHKLLIQIIYRQLLSFALKSHIIVNMAWPFKSRKLTKYPEFCKFCFNHCVAVIYKGHRNDCNYKDCSCQKCQKTAEKLAARKLRRRNNRRIRRQNGRQGSMFNPNVAASNMTHDVESDAGVHERNVYSPIFLESFTPTSTYSGNYYFLCSFNFIGDHSHQI